MNPVRSLRIFQRTFNQAFATYHAPFRISRHKGAVRALSIPAIRNRQPSHQITPQRRAQSTDASEARPRPLTDREKTSQEDADTIAVRKALSPAYQLWFTCKKCLERTGHTVSKQAYHFGTCVINCPKCKSQHLISDHLKIFGDEKMTLEDIAKLHGEKLRKGKLGMDGDVEFYTNEAEETIMKEEERIREEKEMTERIRENMKP